MLCTAKICDLDLEFWWSRTSLVVMYRGCLFVYPRVYLLLIHNKLADLLSVIVLSLCYPEEFFSVNCYNITLRFIKLFLRLAMKYDQKFFHISKVVEGLCIGETLCRVEGMQYSNFLHTVIDSVYEASGFRYEGSDLENCISHMNIPMLNEISCLSKIAGHPFCSIEAGAMDLKMKVTEQKLINIEAVVKSIRYAKEHFIRSFLKRHKRWPLVDLSNCSKSLTMARLKNIDPRNISHQRKYGIIKLTDYDGLILLKNVEFDWIENFLPYVKDRTISLGKNRVFEKYITQSDVDYNTDWKATRALLAYLLWPESKCDHLTYLQNYIAGEWDLIADYLIIRVVPKEKEHKVNARGFGCKTLQDRARSIIQEVNAAEFLDQYSDEHAMTQGELALMNKLYAYRNMVRAYPGYKAIMINVDASSWNNRFRHAAVAPLMNETLDKIFDTPIFSKTHQAYQKSFIYIPDSSKCYYWDGQEGGIEGLNQDTWVITYISQIKVCMEDHPYPYHILCKGDDLRVVVMIPPALLQSTSIDKLKSQLLLSISKIGKKFGHVIKVEDSYASESYFAFSKDAYVNGVQLSQSFRKIQKCYGANNAFINTIDDHIASSFSNAHSASKVSPSPIACYIVAIYWSCFYLCKDKDYKVLSPVELSSLLLIPNLFGGFPIIYLHNFFIRAESDLLTSFLELLKHSKHLYPEMFRVMKTCLKQKWIRAPVSITGLCIDPYSLSIDKPPQASTVLRQSVISLVERHTRNKKIKELFDARKTDFMNVFMRILMSCNIYNAKIFSALYTVTPEGIITELIRKFESGRSIYDFLVLQQNRSKAFGTLKRVKRADIKVQKYRIAMLKGCISESTYPDIIDTLLSETTCSTEASQLLRDWSWGKSVLGVTQPAVHHMIRIGPISFFGSEFHAANNHFEYRFSAGVVMNDFSPVFSIGPYKPFLGATTGTGLSDPANIFALKLHNLLDVYRWSFCTILDQGRLIVSNMPLLVENMIRLYIEKDVEEVLPFTAKRVLDKTVQHHVRANQYKTSVVPNTLSNPYTKIEGFSYSHVRLSDDPNHYLINFHQIYCHVVSFISYNSWCGCSTPLKDERVWAVTTQCKFCTQPIIDIPIVANIEPLPHITMSNLSDISHEAIQKIREELETYAPTNLFVHDKVSEQFTYEDAEMAIIQHFIDYNVREYTSIRDRYTQHELSPSGCLILKQWEGRVSTNIITVTDLRSLSFGKLIDDVSLAITHHVINRHPKINAQNALSLIASVPSNEHEWLGLLFFIHMAGKLADLQSYLMKRYPTLVTSVYEQPTSFSPVFGYVCYMHANSFVTYNTIYILSTEENMLIPFSVRYRIHVYRQHLIRRREEAYNTPNQSKDILIQRAIRLIYLSLSKELDDKEFDISNNENPFITICLFEIPDREECVEEMIMYSEDIEEGNDVFQLYRLRYDLPWEAAIMSIREEETVSISTYNNVIDDYKDNNIVLKRSDLVSCKNLLLERGYTYRERHQIDGKLQQIGIHIHHPSCPNIRIMVTGSSRQEFVDPPTVIRDTASVPYKDWYPNDSWCYRTHGLNNLSSSKLLYLFNSLKITSLPSDQTYICFADGYEGFSHIISEMTEESLIIFNTKPYTPESQPKPVGALATVETRHNSINSDNIEVGHYDVTIPETFSYIVRETPYTPTLVTCDLEMLDRNNDYWTGLKNIIIFTVRNGTKGTILILKVYIWDTHRILQLIALIIRHYSLIYVCESPCHTSNGEAFIVAVLEDTNILCSYNQNLSYYPMITTINKFTKFQSHCLENYTLLNERKRRFVVTPPINTLVEILTPRIPCYGWSKLTEVSKVTILRSAMFQNAKSIRTWGQTVVRHLNIIKERYKQEVHGLEVVRDEYNTLSHKYIMLFRLMQLEGFSHVWHLAATTESDPALHYDEFVENVKSLLLAYMDIGIPEDVVNDPTVTYLGPLGREINWMIHYVSGVKWGVSSYAYGHTMAERHKI